MPRRTPVIGRMLGRRISVNWLDTSARLAAQTFLAALPLLIVLAAFAPKGVKDVLVDSVQALLGEDAIGVLVTLVSATARMAAWRWLVSVW